MGLPLADLTERFKPTSKAKFVELKTPMDPKQMSGECGSVLVWCYTEAIVSMRFMERMPVTTWEKSSPNEYKSWVVAPLTSITGYRTWLNSRDRDYQRVRGSRSTAVWLSTVLP